MGNALKVVFNHHNHTIDDDILEACLKTALPMNPNQNVLPIHSAAKKDKANCHNHLLLQNLLGPFSNTY